MKKQERTMASGLPPDGTRKLSENSDHSESTPHHMRSISTRVITGTSLFIAVFFVLLATAVSWSVYQRAQSARFDALEGVIYGVLSATDIDANAALTVDNNALPDQSLNRFDATRYAEIIANDGTVLWRSNSTLEPLPDIHIRPIGDLLSETVTDHDRELLRVQYVVAWELGNGEELPLIVNVAEHTEELNSQLIRFNRALWLSLIATALFLPVLMWLMLRISLKPLRALGDQIQAIEQGKRDVLSGDMPAELAPLTQGLNALLNAERERHTQYRNLLNDLRHNLKTPLSVMRNLSPDDTQHTTIIQEQTQLMQDTLERYAQRASVKSPRYLLPPIDIVPYAQRMTATLERLYGQQSPSFTIEPSCALHARIDPQDALEILGNLLDNACKYGASHVNISPDPQAGTLTIDDNGPGFPGDVPRQLIERGLRADTHTDGQGIGLAASDQLLRSYGGSLQIDQSPQGGARVVLILR